MKEVFKYFLTLVIAFNLGFTATSCSNKDNYSCSHDEDWELYQYLNAAEEREDVTPEERQEYAFYAWRMERENVAGMPKNFRTCQSDFKECEAHNGFDPDYVPSRKGLDELKVSASSDFSDAELDSLVTEIRKLHDGPITVIDLRKESHALLNGYHVSQYGKYNWANIGLSRETIIAQEDEVFHGLMGQQLTMGEMSSKNDYEPVNPITIDVTSAETEAEACAKRGLGYQRFTALDHCFPDPRSMDDFITFARNLPADTWLHFHCQAGKGRTTLFLVVYDFLRNPDVAEKDVVYRHYLQGGNFMYYQGDDADEKAWKVPLAKEKAAMVPLVYQYIQENLPQGFPLTWKQWKDRIR